METHESFLRGIFAEPAEDTPRLVYADWLDDNQNPRRAEFIRLQIEIEKMPTTYRQARDRVVAQYRADGRMKTFEDAVRLGDVFHSEATVVMSMRNRSLERASDLLTTYRVAWLVSSLWMDRIHHQTMDPAWLDPTDPNRSNNFWLTQVRMAVIGPRVLWRRGFPFIVLTRWGGWVRQHGYLTWSPERDSTPPPFSAAPGAIVAFHGAVPLSRHSVNSSNYGRAYRYNLNQVPAVTVKRPGGVGYPSVEYQDEIREELLKQIWPGVDKFVLENGRVCSR